MVGRVGVVDSKEHLDSPLLISCRWARVRSRGLPRPRGVQFVCLAKADGVIMRTGVAHDGVRGGGRLSVICVGVICRGEGG